ncbi:hypothetical protein DYB28_013238 [Aphanomyces astaci]|nr:hypothetical protein DYB25_003115 [Aphanomyces astaci]RHY21871.1 hypothetical protein DYB36_004852 [Aphanomyces astaci]RHY51544.1 hypothetical protein DYB34_005979 [Aphanomyces astaci]RHY83767.1 hypothetical protein DYB26_001660 [Aphanomyces astaci]RHZ14995.1 hypothetical protein DYB31_000878 [Aphanomyces astaci]
MDSAPHFPHPVNHLTNPSDNSTPAITHAVPRKGRPLHSIWSVFTQKVNAHLASEGPRAQCLHCHAEVLHHNKTACVERHLRRCAPFLSHMHSLTERDQPDWFKSVRTKKRHNNNASLVFSIKNTSNSALGGMTAMAAAPHVHPLSSASSPAVYPTLMHAAATAPTIKLNVGGTYFETTKATLLQHELSFFHDLLLTTPTRQDGKDDRSSMFVYHMSVVGAYFLDLDPKAFTHVMDFLRYGELCVEGLNSWERRKLAKTMGFLKLHTIAQHAWNPFAESALAAAGNSLPAE